MSTHREAGYENSETDTSDRIQSGGIHQKYQDIVSGTVIPYQYSVLWDKAEGVEKSHVAQNFINAGRALRGEDAGDGFYGMVFQDSDAYKWLEAAAYSLALRRDAALERQADELISLIAASQDEDGYLNTYFTIKDREKRWTNLLEGHELYCSGHLIEAASRTLKPPESAYCLTPPSGMRSAFTTGSSRRGARAFPDPRR